MTRILFVDDEPRVLDGLRRTLRVQRDRWEMTFALGGELALRELEQAPYDVIVSDMRMPEIDGLALLTAARDRWPHMARIILSGHMDMDVAVRAASVAHQFLAKPCEATVLEEAVERTQRLGALLGDETLRTAVGEIGTLAAQPAVYAELERVVADPAAGIADVSAIVEREVALTAKVLQLVNSSFFGLSRHVTAVEHAVTYLGVNVIRALVLSHEIADAAGDRALAPGFSLAAHQMHALRVAVLARKIVGGGPAGDDAFLAGVLHDVGELLLATQRHDWFTAAAAHAKQNRLALHEAETALHGVSHAEVGAYLVGLWGLPFRIVEAIAHHHEPLRAAKPGVLDVLAAVHVADALVSEAEAAEQSLPREERASQLDAELAAALANNAKLETWRELAARNESAR